jgi:hypothetical protein
MPHREHREAQLWKLSAIFVYVNTEIFVIVNDSNHNCVYSLQMYVCGNISTTSMFLIQEFKFAKICQDLKCQGIF